MKTSGPVLRSRPRGRHITAARPGASAWPTAAMRPGPAARQTSRPVVLSLASTLFAVATYHFLFGPTLGPAPSWDTRTVAAAVLFHAALSLRLALPQDGGRTRWTFVRGDRSHAPAPASRPPNPLGGSLTRMLRLLWAFLARLLRPCRAPLSLAPPGPAPAHRRGRPAHAPSLPLLLANTVVRRGPPARPPLTA
ncbi:hypothetical protein [Streptomyces atriruber]|uniref:hypothetical protein n=1 Tax=Streptomyces atriruber TaxID=545121 RepID=UPI0012FF1E5E|nr:hypothetical protein [Streptomyces atriruber]